MGLLEGQFLIAWDEIQGEAGPGSPLQFICMGGFGVIFKGVYQVMTNFLFITPKLTDSNSRRVNSFHK